MRKLMTIILLAMIFVAYQSYRAIPALAAKNKLVEHNAQGIAIDLSNNSFVKLNQEELRLNSFWLHQMFVIDLDNHIFRPVSFTKRYTTGLVDKIRIQQFNKQTVRIVLHMRKKVTVSTDYAEKLLISFEPKQKEDIVALKESEKDAGEDATLLEGAKDKKETANRGDLEARLAKDLKEKSYNIKNSEISYGTTPALTVENNIVNCDAINAVINLSNNSFVKLNQEELQLNSFWLHQMFVIDLKNHIFRPVSFTKRYTTGLVDKIRIQQFNKQTVRIVLHMRKKVTVSTDYAEKLLISFKQEQKEDIVALKESEKDAGEDATLLEGAKDKRETANRGDSETQLVDNIEGEESKLELEGEIRYQFTWDLAQDDSLENSRHTGELELKAKYSPRDEIDLVATIKSSFAEIKPDSSNNGSEIELGESYLRWSGERVQLELGKLYRTWGVIDGVRTPLDSINSRDFTKFIPDDDAAKLPNWMASLKVFSDPVSSSIPATLELLVVKAEADRFCWKNSKWSPLTLMGNELPTPLQEKFFKLEIEEQENDLEFGARLTLESVLKGGDIGISYYRGHEKGAHFDYPLLSTQKIQISHPSTNTLMLDWEKVSDTLPIVWRGEVGFHQQSFLKDDFSSSQEDMLYLGAGFDYSGENYRIELVLSDNILLGDSDGLLFAHKHNLNFSGEASWNFYEWGLDPYLRWSLDLNEGGFYLGPGLTYNLGEKLNLKGLFREAKLEIRLDCFSGSEDSQLGALEDKTQAYIGITVPF